MWTVVIAMADIPMKLRLDADVQAVAEFMQRSIPASRLMGVVAGLHTLAPLIWGRYDRVDVIPADLSAHDPRTQSSATQCGPVVVCAGDGSVGEEDVPP
jgi:hypothetical protein